ncbi:hypothetical protein B0H12DRAFT_1234921 [Mycena haematopus]|nr:hypothetical protein B0H12DRAFT_1234921 [Mycena haematopus]
MASASQVYNFNTNLADIIVPSEAYRGRLLSDPCFEYAVREGLKAALTSIGANAWQGYVSRRLNNVTTATSEADLEFFARITGPSIETASMSPRGVDQGIVDPDLLVKGIRHLCIVDASDLGNLQVLPKLFNFNFLASPPLKQRCISSRSVVSPVNAKWE